MMRLAFFLTTLLTTFLATMFATDLTDDRALNFSAIVRQDQRVHEQSVRYYHFKGTFQATIEALARGEMTLREGQARVLTLAHEFNPDYLNHLKLSEVGASDEERLARNLVAHVRFLEEILPNPDSHLPELEADLNKILQEMRLSQ